MAAWAAVFNWVCLHVGTEAKRAEVALNIDLDTALAQLEKLADPEKAAQMAAYHKAPRRYLGVANPVLDAQAREWRQGLSLEARCVLATALWETDIHEARVAAAKLLTQARIRPDDEVWRIICSWVPQFDAWAIADHTCMAGHRRVVADTTRLDDIAKWTTSDHMWTRRAALVMTLPWTRMRHPKPADIEIRERVLGWAAGYVNDRDWFIQKAVAWWLRDLSKHAPDATRSFLDLYGHQMAAFARREAARKLD